MVQSVTNAFTAEERDSVRSVADSLLVSWKKESLVGGRTFTIAVSTIGGNDVIGANPGGVGSPYDYNYFDESPYVMSLGWERELTIPVGGLSRALAESELDNTSGRFLPDYMGGTSELFTAILPRRPMIINAGFEVNGADETVPVFAGQTRRAAQVNTRNRQVSLEAEDYVGFFDNKSLGTTALYTGVTTDQLIENIFVASGMSTAQYELDTGLNTIPFTIIEADAKFSDVINDLAVAENGFVFQDEQGVFKFWNRQHFDNSPFTETQRVLHTAQVIDAESPNEDHVINVVEVTSNIYEKRSAQQIFTLSEPVEILSGIPKEIFVNLDDPVLQVTSQTISGNTQADGSGSSIVVTVGSRYVFAQAIKYVVTAPTSGFVTQLDINGRSAVVSEELYSRTTDGSSVTAYQERPLSISNRYIQDRTWAESYSQLLLDTYSEPDSIQKITIRAIPELQLGDVVSWQGIQWRVYAIRSKLDPSSGFLQDLVMVRRSQNIYFKIGISTIASTDSIAP